MASSCCASKFSAESINEWRAGARVHCTTPLALYSLFEGTEEDCIDPSNANQKQITVAHEIRKICLVFFMMCSKTLLSVSFRVRNLKSYLFQFFSVQGVHGMSMVCGGQVSDNKAFNRLFSFVGHRTMNQDMWVSSTLLVNVLIENSCKDVTIMLVSKKSTVNQLFFHKFVTTRGAIRKCPTGFLADSLKSMAVEDLGFCRMIISTALSYYL